MYEKEHILLLLLLLLLFARIVPTDRTIIIYVGNVSEHRDRSREYGLDLIRRVTKKKKKHYCFTDMAAIFDEYYNNYYRLCKLLIFFQYGNNNVNPGTLYSASCRFKRK